MDLGESELTENIVSKKRGRKPHVQNSEIIGAIKKSGKDIFDIDKKTVRGEKDEGAGWNAIIMELNSQIKLHNLRMRIKNEIEFFYNRLIPTSTKENSSLLNIDLHEDKMPDETSNIYTVQDSTRSIRTLLNDSIYRQFIREISRTPIGSSFYWPEPLSFWKKNSVALNFFAILKAHNIDLIVKKSGQTISTNIVLFQLMSELHGQPIPLFQSFVDYSDEEFKEKEFIKYMLGEVLKEKVSAFRILLIEVPSITFVEAACFRYNYMSLRKYSDLCFECSIGISNTFPPCIIQVNSFSFVI